MEIKKSFSLKLFLVILAVAIIPVVMSFLYLLKVKSQTGYEGTGSDFLVFFLFIILTIGLAMIGTIFIFKPLYDRLIKYNQIARKIAGGKFDNRLPIVMDDELGKLAKFFNILTKEFQNLIMEKGAPWQFREKDRINTILHNVSDGVILTDTDDEILLFNSVAESWFGIQTEKNHDTKKNGNHKIDHLIKDDKILDFYYKVKNSEYQESSPKIEIQIKPPHSAKEITLQPKVTKVIGRNNDLVGIATIFRDITEAKEINRKKTELVSMVSHELRSPLTSIAGFSELLLDDNVTRYQARDYADIILKESRHLNDLINKYLDISRIESGKSQVHKTTVNMEEVVRSVLGMHSYLADKKNISVGVDIAGNISDIQADREMVGEVVLNLFSNAIKYSPAGKRIDIRIEENDDYQIVSVIDQGYGIPEDSLDKIFNKFYRVKSDEHVQNVEGSGLGLSLVKEIIIQHDGDIWVESRLNQGSTFMFTLPKTGEEQYIDSSMDEIIRA